MPTLVVGMLLEAAAKHAHVNVGMAPSLQNFCDVFAIEYGELAIFEAVDPLRRRVL